MLLVSFLTLMILSNKNVVQAGIMYGDRWNEAHVGYLEFDQDYEDITNDYFLRELEYNDNVTDDYEEEKKEKSYGLRDSKELDRQKVFNKKEENERKIIREEEAINDDLHEKSTDPEYITTYSYLLHENDDLLNKIKKYRTLINLEASGYRVKGLTWMLILAIIFLLN